MENLSGCSLSHQNLDQKIKAGQITNSSINLKVTVRKSNKKKILYAEAERDVVAFLFSFLTTPLGSIYSKAFRWNLYFGEFE